MRFDITEAGARRAIRILFAFWLFISGIALAFPYRPATWPIIAGLHVIGILALLQVGTSAAVIEGLRTRFPRTTRITGDWYAILLIPVLYSELAVLNVAVWNGHFFDAYILVWEERLFGGHPFRELAVAFPNLLLSEFLHFSYLAYYFIIYAPAVYLYARGRRTEHQQLIFALLLAFFAHYIFFVYFPVQGPRYIWAPPEGILASGFFYNLAHRLLEAGSARGAAFPSSHVGVSAVASAFAFLALPRALAVTMAIITLALAVGAVYGGFHYATDAVIGGLFGLLLFVFAPHLARRLSRSP